MATEFELNGSLTLRPVWWHEQPEVTIYLDQTQLWHGRFATDLTIRFDAVMKPGSHFICVDFHNKKDSDSDLITGHDMAVIIKNLDFFGISHPKFVWAGTYTPVYPEPWYSQQLDPPPSRLINQDRLSWNGRWCLDFSVPVFTWMHQILDLGWIYD